VNPGGLHIAFLNPCNLEGLSFDIIRKLAKLQSVDMLIHVSMQDLQRNLDEYSGSGGVLDSFAPGWRDHVRTKRLLDQAYHLSKHNLTRSRVIPASSRRQS
jgi:hypothetical protein